MMEVLQVALLILVGIGSVGVVLTRDTLRQTIVLSFYGLLLTILFFLFQAPDVALSMLTVGTVALPLMVLLAIAKVRGQSQ